MALVPAYGRDYTSAGKAIKDLIAGKDFILADISSPWDGKYCSVKDFPRGTKLEIRYSNLRKVTVYNVTGQELWMC